jgi:hypothetical protein
MEFLTPTAGAMQKFYMEAFDYKARFFRIYITKVLNPSNINIKTGFIIKQINGMIVSSDYPATSN